VRVSQLADCNATDSALAVLADVCRDSLNEHNRYYYDLMNIKARDKAYLDITTDTTITDIIAYFERRGSENELGEAYYYGGRVSREQGDAPQALDYYQKALDVLTSPEHMYRKGKIASQMGQIFLELYMFEQAKPKFQEAIAYQTECEDSVGLMYNYSDLAYTCRNINKFDSALVCYKKSIEFATNLYPNGIDEVESRIALVDFLMSQKDYEQAIKEYRIVEPLLPKLEVTNYERMASLNILLILKDYKKAESIALELLESSSLNCKEFAYNALKEIAEYHNEAKMLYHYTKKYNEILDSINSKSSRDAVIFQDSFYNYSQREKKNMQLEMQKSRNLIISFIIVSGLLLILLIIIIIYIKVKKQNGILFYNNILLQNKNEELSNSYDKLLLSSERTETELRKQYQIIKSLENENTTLKTGLFDNSETIIEISDNIRNLVCERIKDIDLVNHILPTELLSSQIYCRIEKAISEENIKLSQEDWLELDVLINKLFPNFKNRILILNNRLREEEYRVALLVKCRFSINGMAYLMNYEKSNIHKIRERMYKKLFGVEGKAIDFDKFIVSL
jgi:tetratricopeptide (TPR) repeat protein